MEKNFKIDVIPSFSGLTSDVLSSVLETIKRGHSSGVLLVVVGDTSRAFVRTLPGLTPEATGPMTVSFSL